MAFQVKLSAEDEARLTALAEMLSTGKVRTLELLLRASDTPAVRKALGRQLRDELARVREGLES